MTPWVELTVSGPVAHLTLTRGHGNALDLQMVEAIKAAVEDVAARADVRSVLISARGHAFCVGGDIGYLRANRAHLPATLAALLVPWNQTLTLLSTLPKAVIIAVDGVVSGGGLGLLWTADYLVASETSTLVSGFAQLGFCCDSGISWHLQRTLGSLRAKEILLENRVIDMPTAQQWGLISRVVSRADVHSVAMHKAQALAQLSLTALAAMKQVLTAAPTQSYTEHMQLEMQTIMGCAMKADVQTGLDAFQARRPPLFTDV